MWVRFFLIIPHILSIKRYLKKPSTRVVKTS